ncbi:peptide chain release factor N(5)-glutamine methyltransferase [Silvibacterium acidisoli]|uniref:peptide chain release factor N(5)-glutamine methyltransferase n=1 Tax=Acidobacteriaceae bacterium ZG23-2 TaxID=2883246 RepID=UPI00406C6205
MAESQTVRAALLFGAAQLSDLPNPRLDAELLLRHVLQQDRAWLLTHPEVELSAAQSAAYEAAIARRIRHEPIQYIRGTQEFYGLDFLVGPGVLIPRPETEHLVEAALERLPKRSPLSIVDVGTGSGILAVTFAKQLPDARVVAVDLSVDALSIARENARRHDVEDRIRFIESDLLAALPGEIFDAVVSNPPYIPDTEVLEPQVRNYEPEQALFAGADGLDIYRRLIPEAHAALRPKGWLLMEFGHGQRDRLAALLSGWHELVFVDDLQGIPRVACARR